MTVKPCKKDFTVFFYAIGNCTECSGEVIETYFLFGYTVFKFTKDSRK